MADYVRPGPLRWLYYAYGGRLPARYREWVHHDIICGTWVLRHLVRAFVQIALPALIVLVALPAKLNLRFLLDTYIVLGYVIGATLVIIPSTEKRLIKAGFSPGAATEERAQRAVDEQRRSVQERRERIAARNAARAARRGS